MDGVALRHELHEAAASVVSGFVAVKAEINGLDVRRLGCAFFSCQQFNGFGSSCVKLHDKINGMRLTFALAVAIPFVSPDGQAVVPLPAYSCPARFNSSLRLEQNKVSLVRSVYLFLGVIHG